MMNIAIIGSRTFNDYEYLKKCMKEVLSKEFSVGHNKIDAESICDITIVSGGAKGADNLGKIYSKDHDFGYIEHEAKWKDLSGSDVRPRTNQYGQIYNANAGHIRNTLIINDSDIIVAFHNGSPGTANSLRKARQANKKIYEFKF